METAQQMSEAVDEALPVDAGVFAAAVADWRMAAASDKKLKKSRDGLPVLEFAENPDILKRVSRMENGPSPVGRRVCSRNRQCVEHATG